MNAMLAVTPGGSVTDDMLAGFYLWYSVSDQMVPLSTICSAFDRAGLDVSRLPEERRPEHVAQEACRSVEEIKTNGRRITVRAELVDRDRDYMIYQITRAVQDKENRVVEHPKALRVLYSFADGSLSFEALDPGEAIDDLQSRIQTHFNANMAQMPGHKIRTLLRHYLEEAGAENMRGTSGGVYFLAKVNPLPVGSKLRTCHGEVIDGQKFLDAVMAMLTEIYGAADMHVVPCINDEGQREFLKRKFLENCAGDLKEYRDELIELVKSKADRKRPFRMDMRSNLIMRRQQIDARRVKFQEILGETLEELDQDMEIADKALATFIKEADDV
jgi:hypothetical protein